MMAWEKVAVQSNCQMCRQHTVCKRVLPDEAHAGVEGVVGVAAGEVAVVAQVDAGALGHDGVGAEAQHHAVARRLRALGGEAQARKLGANLRSSPATKPPRL